jgi:hypothetical protein
MLRVPKKPAIRDATAIEGGDTLVGADLQLRPRDAPA